MPVPDTVSRDLTRRTSRLRPSGPAPERIEDVVAGGEVEREEQPDVGRRDEELRVRLRSGGLEGVRDAGARACLGGSSERGACIEEPGLEFQGASTRGQVDGVDVNEREAVFGDGEVELDGAVAPERGRAATPPRAPARVVGRAESARGLGAGGARREAADVAGAKEAFQGWLSLL